MTPAHHAEPEELIAYASGAGPEWVSLVIACHLTYCAECRREVTLLDGLGGVLLETLDRSENPEASLPEPSRRSEVVRSKKEIPAIAIQAKLPLPLHDYFDDATPKWRFLAPGVQQIPLSFSVGGIRAKVVKFRPGFTIPEHAHTGLEMVLVLDGELVDSVSKEVFGCGDLSRRDVGATHSQHVTSEDPCVCLVVSAAPIVPTSTWGKVLKALTGV